MKITQKSLRNKGNFGAASEVGLAQKDFSNLAKSRRASPTSPCLDFFLEMNQAVGYIAIGIINFPLEQQSEAYMNKIFLND